MTHHVISLYVRVSLVHRLYQYKCVEPGAVSITSLETNYVAWNQAADNRCRPDLIFTTLYNTHGLLHLLVWALSLSIQRVCVRACVYVCHSIHSNE